MLLGVAGGLGERLGVDPVLIRVAFAVLAIAGGSGVVLYLLAWAVSVEPDDDTARARPVRRPSLRQAFALGLVVLGTMLLLREVGLWFGDQIVWPIALAAAGSAVIWARSDDRDRARWARIPGNPIEAMFTGRVGLIRIVVGGLLVASGLGLGFANTGADLSAAGDALLGVAITLIGLVLIFGPWGTRLVHQLAEERRGRIRSEARAEMAAHLHDSVLHTLALIQRADASPEVVGLARRQERELRAWLYRAPVPPTAGCGRPWRRSRPGSSSGTTCPSTSWWWATPRSTTPPGRWSTPARRRPSTPPGTRGRRWSRSTSRSSRTSSPGSCATRARGSTPTRSRPTGAASPTRSAAGSGATAAASSIVSSPGEGTEVQLRLPRSQSS